jgi:hypothetical protein
MLFHLFFQSDSAEVFILLARRAGEGALINLARTSVISQVIEKGIDILQACLVRKTCPPRNQILSAILQLPMCHRMEFLVGRLEWLHYFGETEGILNHILILFVRESKKPTT